MRVYELEDLITGNIHIVVADSVDEARAAIEELSNTPREELALVI